MDIATIKTLAVTLALPLLAAGCGQQPVFKTLTLYEDVPSYTTGARQRLISNMPTEAGSRPGRIEPVRIVCVEPSPDVAATVASSFGLGAGIVGQGAVSVSGAQSEGLAQLAERTTAIQALLKQGYQACIDYMNGAITGTTYSLRQARLDDLLVTLVLAENAAGAFGRRGASIGGEAAADASASASLLPIATQNLQQASNDLAAKEKAVAEKQAALTQAEAALARETDEAKKPPLEAEVAAKKGELDAATAERDAALRSMTGLAKAVSSASAKINSVQGAGGLTAVTNPEIAKTLAGMQAAFINKDPEHAYISTCLTELGLWRADNEFDERLREKATQDIETGKLEPLTIKAYSKVSGKTRLTDLCEKSIGTVIARAQANTQQRRMAVLEIEAKRVDLINLQTKPTSTEVSGTVHPSAVFAVAEAEKTTLATVSKVLNDLAVPAVSKTFDEDDRKALQANRTAALEAGKRLSKTAEDLLSASKKTAITAIEAKYTLLAADPRRLGTEQERDEWREDFALQQKEAGIHEERLSSLAIRMKAASGTIKAITAKINATS